MRKVIALLSIIGISVSQRCPKGWDYFEDSCYKFPNVLATWGTALDICLQMKSYLIEIETPEENKFVETHNLRGHNFWTGGNDIEVESEWRWIMSGKTFNYTDWDRQDPNNLQPNNLNYREDCMLIYHIHHQWHDAHCGDKNFFICEQEAGELPPTEPTYPTTTFASTTNDIVETTTQGPFIIG